jgi:hypothetical protein
MSEKNTSVDANATSGAMANANDATSGASSESTESKSYTQEFVSKLLAEKKNTAKALEDERNLRQKYEQEKLEAEGNWKQLAEKSKQEAESSKKRLQDILQNFGTRTLKQEFYSQAKELGCVDPDLAYLATNFDGVDFDENLQFDTAIIKQKLEEVAKAKPILFKKNVSMPNDLTPNSNGSGSSGQGFKGITDEQLKQLI